MAKKLEKPCNVEILEMLAARHAVIFAMELGIQQSHFKGDLKSVIKTL